MWKSKNVNEKSPVKTDPVLGPHKNYNTFPALNFSLQHFDINLHIKYAMVQDTDQR